MVIVPRNMQASDDKMNVSTNRIEHIFSFHITLIITFLGVSGGKMVCKGYLKNLNVMKSYGHKTLCISMSDHSGLF